MLDKVITISREFGSGGRELGMKLAERLGLPFYDKDLISLSAEESDLAEEAFLHYDEHLPVQQESFEQYHYSPFSTVYEVSMSDQIFLAQSRVIRKLAEQAPVSLSDDARTECWKTALICLCMPRWKTGLTG